MPQSQAYKSVEKMIATNRRLEDASSHAAALGKGNNVADWHEKDAKRLHVLQQRLAATQAQGAGSMTVASIAVPGSEYQKNEVAMQTGTQMVRQARRAKLRALFEQEAAAYEQELRAMGMALVKQTI